MSSETETGQIYRLRAAASGREGFAEVRPGHVYRDASTGEELAPVAVVLPAASAGESLLPRSPENLWLCESCGQLIPADVDSCLYCD